MYSLNNLVNDLYDVSFRTIDNVRGNVEKYASNVREIATYPIRHPRETLTYVGRELKDKRLPLSTYLAMHVGDFITTQIDANKHGIYLEANPLTRNLMESYGILEGELLAKAIIVPLSIVGLFGVGKFVRASWPFERDKRFVEHLPYYVASGAGIYIIIGNINLILK